MQPFLLSPPFLYQKRPSSTRPAFPSTVTLLAFSSSDITQALLDAVQPAYINCWSDVILPETIEFITVPSNVCNDKRYDIVTFSPYPNLKRLVVGNYSYRVTNKASITQMEHLEYLELGHWCFAMENALYWPERQFTLEACPKVKQFIAYSYAMQLFYGFHLRNLPSLEEIYIEEECFGFASMSLTSTGVFQE